MTDWQEEHARGRALDEDVAKYVFEYQRIDVKENGYHFRWKHFDRNEIYTSESLPHFSTNMGEAWGVIQFCQENWFFSKRRAFWRFLLDGVSERLKAPLADRLEIMALLTPAEICVAALKTVSTQL